MSKQPEFEVKVILAHRQGEMGREFLVQWSDEEFKLKWEIVELRKMSCYELIEKYDRKRARMEELEKALDVGFTFFHKDKKTVVKQSQLASIEDFSLDEDHELYGVLPDILDVEDVDGGKAFEIKSFVTTGTSDGVVNVLCQSTKDRFKWKPVSEITKTRTLLKFYLVRELIKCDSSFNPREDDKEQQEDGGPAKKKRKGSSSSLNSSSSSSSSTAKSNRDEQEDSEDISDDEEQASALLKCVYCLAPFTKKSAYNDHQRNHYKFPCNWCGHDFNWRYLKTHALKMHQISRDLCFVCGVENRVGSTCPSNCKEKRKKLSIKNAPRE